MPNYVNDMWPGSRDESPSASGRSSRLSSAAGSRSPRSSRSRSSVSSRWSSSSRSRRRSRSRSRSRRRHQRKYRRYSRSYSRSRSRSRSRRRYRESHYVVSRRYYRSPSPSPDRSRSRSRSRGRSYYRRAYAVTRGRRYYGFGRSVYPEEHRSWRARSRTRSRSPTPFRLSEKDRMELLEIAKANAAKALGTTNFELPPSLRVVPVLKETNHETIIPNKGAKFELSEKLTEDGTTNASEKSSQQKSSSFNNNFVAKPMLQKSAKAIAEETSSGSPKTQKKSPYELWKPV
ncbi:arginine/serine-rich protein 1 [Artibeus jamaicensis]|uniref:arginine/serine-rich protein 1 n=1 Tax=Artibeus jamaicensis TaxID=9417 RepID=UPI00235B121E|nr:arginine/serine-rich protein 1 [Artibeus jamaicensis]